MSTVDEVSIAAARRRTEDNHYHYKDFGANWIGQIPAHWQTRRLKAICRFAYGESLPEEQRIDGDVAVYGSNGIVGDHNRANAKAPCLIVGRKGSFGKIAYSDRSAFAIDTTYYVDETQTKEYLRWLYYCLVCLQLDSFSKDSAVPGLAREDVYARIVPYCPRDEQRAIAAFLDRETAKIDALVARKERLIALLAEKRTALISHAVTKGLDPNAPMKESGSVAWGRIPVEWEITELRHLVQRDRPIMYGIVLPGPNVDDGVPIVKGGNCEPGKLRLDLLSRTTREIEANYVRSRLRGGDIVYAIRGSIGMAGVVPVELTGANLTQDAARIAPIESICRRWLLFVLQSLPFFSKLDAGAMGATIRGINIRDLKRAILPVPRYDEQQVIAEFLTKGNKRIDAMIDKVREGISRLREYRTALISAAVTGKIDVRGEA